MKDLRSRLGFNKNMDIVDARQLLKAKRSNINKDAREYLPKKSNTLFTLPIKTINNDVFTKKRTEDVIGTKRSNDVNFVINKPNNMTMMTSTTQRMSGRKFTDPEVSLGIFSRSQQQRHYPYDGRSEDHLRAPIKTFVDSQDSSRNIVRASTSNINIRGSQRNNSVSIEPIRKFQSNNELRFSDRTTADYKNGHESRSTLRTGVPKRTKSDSSSPETVKRSRSDNLDKIKFVVVNDDRPLRPSLTTPRLANKSFISPIQGYRIEVKNLHPQVNVDDVFELFTSLCEGDLRSCNLVRPGYAEVVFRTLKEAQKSIDEFHGRELDGKPMNLKLVTPAKEHMKEAVDSEVMTRISKIQSGRKPSANILINKDAVFRSMFLKSEDSLKSSSRPFKFSVTL